MDNPFLKRATEHLKDTEAFLAVISPAPVQIFLAPHGKTGALYDRLVMLRGTPGSGKTTLARLFDFASLSTLLRHQSTYRPIIAALADCGAVRRGRLSVLACRLNMETDYRNIWELPYSEDLRIGLTASLIQARAVLAWVRALDRLVKEGFEVRVVPRAGSDAALNSIGGPEIISILEVARTVEKETYKVAAALVPPRSERLPEALISAYRPFDVIESFVSREARRDHEVILRPLVILDDANVLHPSQFRMIQRWLARRELSISRWILSRLDLMQLEDAFDAFSQPSDDAGDLAGITAERDTLEIMLQNIGDSRREFRTQFRRMARDMANRYLAQMPMFHSRKLDNLGDMLSSEQMGISSSREKELQEAIDKAQAKFNVSEERRKQIENQVSKFCKERELAVDIRLAMERILLHRYVNRIPQRSLFEDKEDPDPSRPLRADTSVYEGARLHLLHDFNRPYYFGLDTLCDAGSENAEQFLHLAATLVEAIATRIIRSREVLLDARVQNDLLREKATEIMRRWNFPECQRVARLVERIATLCKKKSLQPNAWLGAGANAYGILQTDFQDVAGDNPDLARVIQFGLAYNAFTLVPRYPCKGRTWCLLELGGIPVLKYGLTLRRGGFIEGSVPELCGMVGG